MARPILQIAGCLKEAHFFYHPGMNTAAKFLRFDKFRRVLLDMVHFFKLGRARSLRVPADLDALDQAALRLLHSYGEAFDTVPLKAHLLWHTRYSARGNWCGQLCEPERILGMLYELAPSARCGHGAPRDRDHTRVPSFCLIQGPGERCSLNSYGQTRVAPSHAKIPICSPMPVSSGLTLPADRPMSSRSATIPASSRRDAPKQMPSEPICLLSRLLLGPSFIPVLGGGQHPLDMLPTSAEFEPSTGLYWHQFSLFARRTFALARSPHSLLQGRVECLRAPAKISQCLG
ncbi:hypothetical protein PAPYR_13204 [Paratrimastix pyriformis]|uniref:Uncharacterized protein n=1 Tax=Paratrimastix pyriformis TaxID=342808 RepID=A0ABQ8U0L6_9EUKA|nr:hypothetical protein PAPYR_13204 [Paratrimastix pyriformis]